MTMDSIHLCVAKDLIFSVRRAMSLKHKISQKAVSGILRFFSLFPLKNYIVFESESDMEDNPRAIFEYMVHHGYNDKYKLIWIVKDKEFCKNNYSSDKVEFVSRVERSKIKQLKFYYLISVSKVFFFSHPFWFKKRKKNQIVVHTGHGTPIKKRKNLSSNFNNKFDWLIVPNAFCEKLNYDFWLCDYSKMILCGYPRNDFLFSGDKQKILNCLIPGYCCEKLIICMPTYKKSKNSVDSEHLDIFSLDVITSKQEFFQLNEYLKQRNIQLIIKIHPLQILESMEKSDCSNIHYIINQDLFNNKVVLYELLGVSDALITDVSSVYIDYLVLNRPIGFLHNSIVNYSRGFTVEDYYQYMPGMKIRNFNDLKLFINYLTNNYDEYETERIRVNEIFNPPQDCYSKIITEKILSYK